MKSAMHSRITQRAAKRKKTAAPSSRRLSRRYVLLILVVMILCGLGLRLRGLSHGLSDGDIYHPDTPRFIWASRQFLDGTYFFRVNNPDYDGYPYFYSHAVEYLWRAVRPIVSFFSHLVLGTDASSEPLSLERLTNLLFWLARLTNVALSTLALLVVYRIAARNIDRTSGLIAAGLLAISPMNIAMAHFATNDTMVCFFTTLTVLFAIRICAAGRWFDYLLGGALVACSFSAKYHGGFVGVTCLLAHVLRYWPPRKTFGRESISRLGLMAIAFFITVLLANPALLVSPGKTFHDFRKFCQYVPAARLSRAGLEMGFFARAWLACTLNFPVLVRSLGPLVTAVAFAGMIRAFFRGKKLVVLASFPAFYILLTFLTKPVQQRFYLAAVLPIMYLLVAALLVELARIKKIKAVTTVAAILILSLAVFYLGKSSLREAFFFSHRDTRKCAKQWAQQNIPSFYRLKTGDYTFRPEPPEAETEFRATAFVSSSLRPSAAPEGSFLLKAFDLEKDALPLFRNPRIEIHGLSSPLLSEGFSLPAYQPIPPQYRNDFVFADGVTFYQDEKMIELKAGQPVSRIFVSRRLVDSAVVIVKNRSAPGSVRIRLGGVSSTFFLHAGGVRWKELKGLRTSFPSSASRHLYRFSASANMPTALAIVALTSEQKGVALYNIAEYAAAYPFLADASRKSDSPLLAAMAYVCGKLSFPSLSPTDEKPFLEKASLLDGEVTPETVQSGFRISLDYLGALSYLSFKPDWHTERGFHSTRDLSASKDSAVIPYREPPDDGGWRVGTPPLLLEPGCYVAKLHARCEPPPDPSVAIRISLAERRTKVTLSEKEFPASSLANTYTGLEFPFEKPAEVAECWVLISFSEYLPLFLDRIEVRPDPIRGLQAVQRLMRIVTSEPDSLSDAGPLDYSALLALGGQRFYQDEHHAALQYYLLAHNLRPDLAEPVRRIQALNSGLTPEDIKAIDEVLARVEEQKEKVEVREANVLFTNGVRLTGYAIGQGPFHPGEKIGLSLYWSVPRTRKLHKELVAWVHFIGEDGKKAFQLDRYLSEDLLLPPSPERIVPLLGHETRIPQGTPPGKYRIEAGLWIPLRDWRPAIASTALPHERYSATIGEILIEPR